MSACLREYRPWRHLGTGACSCFKQDLIKRFVWKRTLRLETIQNVIDTSAQPAISFLLFFPLLNVATLEAATVFITHNHPIRSPRSRRPREMCCCLRILDVSCRKQKRYACHPAVCSASVCPRLAGSFHTYVCFTTGRELLEKHNPVNPFSFIGISVIDLWSSQETTSQGGRKGEIKRVNKQARNV